MIAVTVTFRYPDGFEPGRAREIAGAAHAQFVGMPGLRSKAFTIDEENREAVNFYVWESEEAARGFFGEELRARVTGLYGVAPEIRFLEVADLVDNH